MLKRRNIIAVTAGELAEVTAWRKAAPDRVIPAVNFFSGEGPLKPEYAQELRKLVKAGKVNVFAEVTAQYRGMAPNDPSLEPFYALAEELDIPVGIHLGHGAPGGPYWAYPKYRAALGNPLLLEDVLVKYPKMRLYVMHAGLPMQDAMLALLFSHPQVYVDISAENIGPRKEFHARFATLCRGRLWAARHVRVGPDGVARSNRPGDRKHRVRRLPDERAEAGHIV